MRGDEAVLTIGPIRLRGKAAQWLGGAILGGILTAIIWRMVNNIGQGGAPGFLQQQPWPVSSIYVCVAIGAVIGATISLVLVLATAIQPTEHAADLAALCERMDFQYTANVVREAIPRYHRLRLFERNRWHDANHLMTGSVEGVKVEVLEFESMEHDGEDTTQTRQTVVLFPDCVDGGLPRFELEPRGIVHKLFLRPADFEGITFKPDEPTSNQDREAIERFGKLYCLTPPLASLEAEAEKRRVGEKLSVRSAGDTQLTSSESDREVAIRRLFNTELLRFFAGRAGWSVESDGRNLVVWRRQQTTAPANLEVFVRAASHLGQALRRASQAEPAERVIPGLSKINLHEVRSRADAGTFFPFFGFGAGGLIGMTLAVTLCMSFKDPPIVLIGVLFFSCPMIGFLIGMIHGHRWRRKPRKAELRDSPPTLDLGSMPSGVDCSPLADTSHSNFPSMRLVRRGTSLVLTASWRRRLLGLILLVFGAVLLSIGIWFPQGQDPFFAVVKWFMRPACWTTGLVFAALGLLLLLCGSRVRLVRDTGQMHYVPKLKWRSVARPLSDILSVQFIPGDLHEIGSGNPTVYRSYQLNLALDDPDEPRINLCDSTDVAWLFATGQEIAQFIGQPFVDLVSDPVSEKHTTV